MDILDQIDAAWDFGDPAGSERRFRSLADESEGIELAEVQTQLARSLGLQKRFNDAHEVLDSISAELRSNDSRLNVRWHLEKGRVANSSGDRAGALSSFKTAWKLAADAGIDFLAIDAGHMIAIASDAPGALEWNARCLALAEESCEPRARNWQGSLLNNLGWTLMDEGRTDEALEIFQRAVVFRQESGRQPALNIAYWCVGHCLRILDRAEDALVIQLNLIESGGDGYAYEEAGECLIALNRDKEAAPHFKRAAELLEGQIDESRLNRLKQLGD